jgi:hypothetical protein
MSEFQNKLAQLDLEEIELDGLEIEDVDSLSNEFGLEALTIGHGLTEIGASSGASSCCCCCPCCSCC